MSQKVVLAVAATAALVASTEARGFPDWSSTGPYNPTPPFSSFDEESMIGLPTPQWVMDQEAAQKINWGKVAQGVGTGLDLYGKAKGIGLFEEEAKAEGDWFVSAGYDNRRGANVGVGVNIRWEEEEELQKLKVDLRKATKIITTANKMGLLEEDADLDEVQKLKLGKVIKGAVQVVKVAGAVGLLEEDEELQRTDVLSALDKALDLYGKAKQVGLFEEGNNYWEVGGGASNGGNWNINGKIGGKFDEEEQLQKINWGKVVGGVNTGLDLYGKGKQVGLFEEGDNYWEVGGGASNGGNWNINGKIGGKFDETVTDYAPRKQQRDFRKPLLQRKKLHKKQ